MYPRYIAGAIWKHDPHAEILYITIDEVRKSFDHAIEIWSTCNLLVLVAGMIVPGKYIGGTPISVRETKTLFSDPRLESIPSILVGPWANFGCGLEGGKLALSSKRLSPPIDFVLSGDPEMVVAQIAESNWDVENIASPISGATPEQIQEYALPGAKVALQHPNLKKGYLIAEIETYRGCPRYVTGGCSFCTEPLYGRPQQRPINNIVNEIQALYELGVRAFRIGKQADLFTYGSTEMGDDEFPTPNPQAIEEIFSKIRSVAPDLDVLHIDNVNPGTIARHPIESRQVAKAIMRHHTPGDVAAFGVESLDPEVIKRNNLKASADEVLEAVRLLNEVGGLREPWGLPHLLPGINLLYGLPGESKQTIDYNMQFLQTLVDESLIVRRINIRQVIGFDTTRLGGQPKSKIKRNQFFKHKEQVREEIDTVMIKRVAPPGTVLNDVFIDQEESNRYLLRQLGTYPLLCHMPRGQDIPNRSSVFVVDHGPRSLTVLPYPLRFRDVSLSQWRAIPGIGAKRAARIKRNHSYSSIGEFETQLDTSVPDWLKHAIKLS